MLVVPLAADTIPQCSSGLPCPPRNPRNQSDDASHGSPRAALGLAGIIPPPFSIIAFCCPRHLHDLLFLRGGSDPQTPAHSSEGDSPFEYFGLQIVRQEGVLATGNAHPLEPEWLRIAPLPSERKEQASAMLPCHMVTYNTSGSPSPPPLFLLCSILCFI